LLRSIPARLTVWAIQQVILTINPGLFRKDGYVMNVRPLSERSDQELKYIAELARETSVGSALHDHGINFIDLGADPVGHLLLSVMLDAEDRRELQAWWQLYLETGVSVMNASHFKRLPERS